MALNRRRSFRKCRRKAWSHGTRSILEERAGKELRARELRGKEQGWESEKPSP